MLAIFANAAQVPSQEVTVIEGTSDAATTALGAIVCFVIVLAVLVHGKKAERLGVWAAAAGALICRAGAAVGRSGRRVWPNPIGRAGVITVALSFAGSVFIPGFGGFGSYLMMVGAGAWLVGEYQVKVKSMSSTQDRKSAPVGPVGEAAHPVDDVDVVDTPPVVPAVSDPVPTSQMAAPVGSVSEIEADVEELVRVLEEADMVTATNRYGVAAVDPQRLIRALRRS